MATAQTIIDSAMRSLGVLAQGASPSTDQTADALEALNMLLGSWSNDDLIQPYRVTENFSVLSGVANRTIGVSGDWNTAKPIDIEAIYIRDANNVDHYIDPKTAKEYAMLQSKGIATGRPEFYYFEPIDSANPDSMAKIFFDKTTAATETFYIVSYKEFVQLASAGTTVALPPAWIRALKFNLAVDMAPEYGKPVSPELAAIAEQSKNHIRLLMSESVELTEPAK